MDVLFQVQASKQGEGIGSTLGEWRGIRSGDCWVESTQGKQQCCSKERAGGCRGGRRPLACHMALSAARTQRW